jgi:hypothetical protein
MTAAICDGIRVILVEVFHPKQNKIVVYIIIKPAYSRAGYDSKLVCRGKDPNNVVFCAFVKVPFINEYITAPTFQPLVVLVQEFLRSLGSETELKRSGNFGGTQLLPRDPFYFSQCI